MTHFKYHHPISFTSFGWRLYATNC